MSTESTLKVVQVIEICIVTDPDGLFKIRPLSDLKQDGYDVNSFDKTQLWTIGHRNYKLNGPVLFGDNKWVSHENTARHLSHIDGGSEIALQLRLYALVSYFKGQGEGYTGEKLSTLQTKLAALKKMGAWLLDKDISSFHQLEQLSDIRLKTLLTDYITKQVMSSSPSYKPRVFKDCFNPVKSLGLIGERTSRFLQEVLDNLFNNPPVTFSHPIIPTDIVRKIAPFATAVIDACDSKLIELEKTNAKLVKHLKENTSRYESFSGSGSDLFNYAARRAGVHQELRALHEYFTDLKVAVYIHLLLFTGMRYNEALSCKVGCTLKSKLDERVFLVEALTHKTANTTYLDTWIANKDTYKAIQTIEKYWAIIATRTEIILQHYRHIMPEKFIHNLEIGIAEKRLFGLQSSAMSVGYVKSGRFEDFEVKSPHFKDKFDLTVTRKSIDELDRLEQNFSQIRGSRRGKPYSVGDTLRLTNHMFRHTFAYFVVANKLGELEDIADQFKHLSLAMTKVYTDKGILSFEEVTDLVDGYERLMTDAIAAELTEQAANNTLRGGAGERFNKAARNLVIGITDSKSPTANVIGQVHFKDLAEFKRFLAKNIQGVRGLPHGYCTAGDSCKLKGASAPSGCVRCGSYIVAETHKVHWHAMRSRAQRNLSRIAAMRPEEQKDHELFTIIYKQELSATERVLGPPEGELLEQEGETS